MRVLVTGAGGFIGRHVTAEVTRRGHDVLAMVRPSSAVPPELEDPAVELVRCDLRRPSARLEQAIAGADAIVHLAAGVGGSARAMFDATVIGTQNLLTAMAAGGWSGRLVHVSSLAVYGYALVPGGATIDEGTPLEPDLGRRDDYAWTKGWQEALVRELAETGSCAVTIVRPGAVHGPGRDMPARLGRRLGTHALLLYGGAARLPLVDVGNLASLLATCVEHPKAAGRVFNAIDPCPPRRWQYLRSRRRGLLVVPVPQAALRAAGSAFARTGGRLPGPAFLEPYAAGPVLRSFRYETTTAHRVLGWAPDRPEGVPAPAPALEAVR
jgi:nucleoside-diphosphate-sugar epimerase